MIGNAPTKIISWQLWYSDEARCISSTIRFILISPHYCFHAKVFSVSRKGAQPSEPLTTTLISPARIPNEPIKNETPLKKPLASHLSCKTRVPSRQRRTRQYDDTTTPKLTFRTQTVSFHHNFSPPACHQQSLQIPRFRQRAGGRPARARGASSPLTFRPPLGSTLGEPCSRTAGSTSRHQIPGKVQRDSNQSKGMAEKAKG